MTKASGTAEEQRAIAYLQWTGWLQDHDRQIYEQGKRDGTKWIPVTERLPEEEGDYFTTQIDENGKEISRVAYYENEWFTRFEVTAWMPLPKPYEKGADDGSR